MDITRSTKLFQSESLFPSDMEPRNANPFAEDGDPVCRINLNEPADFIKSPPVPSNGNNDSNMEGNERRQSLSAQKSVGAGSRASSMEAPCSPGWPVLSFSYVSGRRRNLPSKWVDAEKWVTAGHESPAHSFNNSLSSTRLDGLLNQQVDVVFSEKSRVTEEKVTRVVSALHGSSNVDHHPSSGVKGFNGSVSSSSTDLLLKDKYADEVQQILPNHQSLDSLTEGFMSRNPAGDSSPEKFLRQEVGHRDVGTETTPIGSLTASRCHTPFKSTSPARHNTPSKMSGPLTAYTKGIIDISDFADKLRLGGTAATTQYDSVTASNWRSREEEEEEVSRSLRHFDVRSELRRSVSDSDPNPCDEEEKIEHCQRYQREEAKIQAWVNLQSAKAEAQSRKFEVKIEKMRLNFEEKMRRRMGRVHERAEERRAMARRQHMEHMERAADQARQIMNRRGSTVVDRSSCGCFPCNNYHHSCFFH